MCVYASKVVNKSIFASLPAHLETLCKNPIVDNMGCNAGDYVLPIKHTAREQ